MRTLKGVIGIFFFSIFLFIVIYIFAPTVSYRFFGVVLRQDRVVSIALSKTLDDTGAFTAEEQKKIDSYLSSKKGRELANEIFDVSVIAKEKAAAAYNTPEVQQLFKTAASWALSTGSSIENFMKTEEGQSAIDKAKKSL